jgi:hypothetical protein
MWRYSVPIAVLDMEALERQVGRSREALAALDVSTPSDVKLVEFEVVGNWFGRRWSRSRQFKWMISVALTNSQNQWIDHVEDIVGRRPRGDWVVLQEAEVALKNAERFARSHLDAIADPDPP